MKVGCLIEFCFAADVCHIQRDLVNIGDKPVHPGGGAEFALLDELHSITDSFVVWADEERVFGFPDEVIL